MDEAVACESCGRPVPRHQALTESVDDWPHFFCSEACRIAWAEHPADEDEL